MSEIRLEVKDISKHFGITKALVDVSFNILKGEIHALIGENGSGKSTLTNSLAGIYQKDSGTFILDGKEVSLKDASGFWVLKPISHFWINLIYSSPAFNPSKVILHFVFSEISSI